MNSPENIEIVGPYLPIFDYIDELRAKIVKEVFSSNQEQTEELIEK